MYFQLVILPIQLASMFYGVQKFGGGGNANFVYRFSSQQFQSN